MKMDKVNKERYKVFIESFIDGSASNLCGGLIKGTTNLQQYTSPTPCHSHKLYTV
jgi:hypothetical protein